jgi:hypothetical protein
MIPSSSCPQWPPEKSGQPNRRPRRCSQSYTTQWDMIAGCHWRRPACPPRNVKPRSTAAPPRAMNTRQCSAEPVLLVDGFKHLVPTQYLELNQNEAGSPQKTFTLIELPSLVRTDRAYRSTNRAKVFWFFFSKKNCYLLAILLEIYGLLCLNLSTSFPISREALAGQP